MLNEISRESKGPRQTGFDWEVKALPENPDTQHGESVFENQVAKPHSLAKPRKANSISKTGSQ
jgi:hypothetical protein